VADEAASIEGDADPSFPAPDDVTGPLQWMGWNDERKAVGDEKRGYDFERGAGLGEVANRAVDRAAAERDRSGLEDAVTRSNSMLIHDGARGAFDGSLTIRRSKSSQVAYSEQISIVLTLNEATGLGNWPRPISRKPYTFLEVTGGSDLQGSR
jgi:hypothetical protein